MAAWSNLSHADAMRQHALKRLFERYGIALSDGEYKRYCRMCADGQAPVIAHGHHGSTVHRVTVRNIEVNVIWRPDVGAIVTFAPKGTRERYTATPVRARRRQQADLAQR